jgi:anti-anti-sigma regulatory factor
MEDRGATLQLKLEGRLSGAWVAELEECWKSYAARSPHKKLIVDLTDTEFIDLAGKYLLRLMQQTGVAITRPHALHESAGG